MNKLLKVFCAIVLLQTSCKTDIDLNAPYKETMVIYSLLDPSDSVHYIRINRAFLGEGNAYTFAQNPDSINYRDILDVKIERLKNNNTVGTIDVTRFEGPPLDSGIFATQPNILYKTTGIDTLYQDSEYKLVVTNRETGLTVTSDTKLVGRITNYVNPTSIGSLDIASNKFVAKWTAGTNGKIYDLTLRFKYLEIDKMTGVIEHKSFDWYVSNALAQTSTNAVAIDIPYIALYQTIRKNIEPNSAVDRRYDGIDFIYTGGTEEFYTYYQVNKPSSGIVQSPPSYTNIDGSGVGLFTSAYTQILKDKTLNSASMDSLQIGQYTGSLGFIP